MSTVDLPEAVSWLDATRQAGTPALPAVNRAKQAGGNRVNLHFLKLVSTLAPIEAFELPTISGTLLQARRD